MSSCVVKDEVSSRVYVADFETGVNIASSAEACASLELGMAFKALAQSELVDGSKEASQIMANFAVKTKGEPRLLCSFLEEGAKLVVRSTCIVHLPVLLTRVKYHLY